MNKQVAKVVIYYTDGTYQEVGNNHQLTTGGGAGAPIMPFIQKQAEDVKKSPSPVDMNPVLPFPEGWRLPGEAGKWPYAPGDIGVKIID